MRTLKFFFLATIISIVALACYEVNDSVTINSNGSGSYVAKMDMGQMLEMLKSMSTEEDIKKLQKTIDTVVNLGNITDTLSNLSKEQRELFHNGQIGMKMDFNNSMFVITTTVPFKSYSQLQTLLQGTGSMSAISGMMKKALPSTGDQSSGADNASPDEVFSAFSVTASKGTIKKTLDAGKFKEIMARPEMQQYTQMGGAGIEIPYTTTINLPSPVTALTGTNATLSADKKTVTIKYNFLSLFDNPEQLNYSISF